MKMLVYGQLRLLKTYKKASKVIYVLKTNIPNEQL